MRTLEEKILRDGTVKEGNILKVDNFLNHQIDPQVLKDIAEEVGRLYRDAGVTKILTIEASGIAIGTMIAAEMGVPLLFAKKNKTSNLGEGLLRTKVASYTHGTTYDVVVNADYLKSSDVVLIVDDFLANGNALKGLIDLVNQAGAQVAGCAIAIEKGFQGGGDALRKQGVRIDSMAIIDSMENGNIVFRREI